MSIARRTPSGAIRGSRTEDQRVQDPDAKLYAEFSSIVLRGTDGTASAFRMKAYQSAAAALAGCCFIISSIPFFISLVVGSALCVATIQV